MRVRAVMSWPVVSCEADDSLEGAARLMWESDCGALPVVDSGGKLLGILTDRDICIAALLRGCALCSIRVSEVMTKQVYACRPADTLEAVEMLMGEKQLHRLPVVDTDRTLIGLISMTDIARWLAEEKRRNGAQIRFLRTLAQICRPRALSRPSLPVQESTIRL